MTRHRTRQRFDSVRRLPGPVRASSPFRASRIESLEPRRVLAAPTLVGLPDQLMIVSGTPVHVALDGWDADGDVLSFQAQCDDAELTTFIPEGNRSLQISVSQHHSDGSQTAFGDMVLELFEGRAPNTTARISQLAEDGFYDGLIFHRVIDGFMIQGGDPDGTGSGGTGTTFPDEFHPQLRNFGPGVLSMANSGPDTNDSQFFIIDAVTSWLDDQHSVFGFLTEGDDVRRAIQTVPTGDDDRPLENVVMEDVSVFLDEENGVLMLSTPEGVSGWTTVTVTVTDENGDSAEYEIDVTVVPPPTWETAQNIQMKAGETTIVQLPELDLDRVVYYSAEAYADASHPEFTVVTNPTAGQMTITTSTNMGGVQWIQATASTPERFINEMQFIPVLVEPVAPVILLAPGHDTGISDGITSRNNTGDDTLEFWVTGVVPEAELRLFVNGVTVGHTEVAKTPLGDGSGTFLAVIGLADTIELEDGTYSIAVRQEMAVPVELSEDLLVSDLSDELVIAVDTQPPTFISSPVSDAFVGQPYVYDVETDEEPGGHLYYKLDSAVPDGMDLDVVTGQITWSPGGDQVGTYPIDVRATDGAGNAATHQFEILVTAVPEFDPIGDKTADEETTLKFFLSAHDPAGDGDGPVAFSLGDTTLPAGADISLTQIDENTAEFTWDISELEGPGVYDVTFRATGSSGTATQTIRVTVDEVNRPPVLREVYDDWTFEDHWTIEEDELLALDVEADDPDRPANDLVFRLAGGVPQGARIDPATGEFAWTPNELQGGLDYEFLVRVTDSAGLSDEHALHISVNEDYRPPEFAPVEPRSVFEGRTLTLAVIARDPDVPSNPIEYSLVEGFYPEGAEIDPVSGVITWEVPEDFLDQAVPQASVELTVRATEVVPEGEQALSTVRTVEVTVINLRAALFAAAFAETENDDAGDNQDDVADGANQAFDAAVAALAGELSSSSPGSPAGSDLLSVNDAATSDFSGSHGLIGTRIGAETGLGRGGKPIDQTGDEGPDADQSPADSNDETPTRPNRKGGGRDEGDSSPPSDGNTSATQGATKDAAIESLADQWDPAAATETEQTVPAAGEGQEEPPVAPQPEHVAGFEKRQSS